MAGEPPPHPVESSSSPEVPDNPDTAPESRAVRFSRDFEQVQEFHEEDPPVVIRTPDYVADEDQTTGYFSRPSGWTLIAPDPPLGQGEQPDQHIWLEEVYLSHDHGYLVGNVVVDNLAFDKAVFCRFTPDRWETVSEVRADYSRQLLAEEERLTQDRFTFDINVSDFVDLANTTLYFCVGYRVDGHEYWDNNDGKNYRASFQRQGRPLRRRFPQSPRTAETSPERPKSSFRTNTHHSPWGNEQIRHLKRTSELTTENHMRHCVPRHFQEFDIAKALADTINEEKKSTTCQQDQHNHFSLHESGRTSLHRVNCT
jgi:hypothetical protein